MTETDWWEQHAPHKMPVVPKVEPIVQSNMQPLEDAVANLFFRLHLRESIATAHYVLSIPVSNEPCSHSELAGIVTIWEQMQRDVAEFNKNVKKLRLDAESQRMLAEARKLIKVVNVRMERYILGKMRLLETGE
jgi:hypothetical protein